MAEINRNWYKIEESNRWQQRTKHWWEAIHHSETFNTHDVSTSPFQPGGVSIISLNKTAHRVIGKGADPTGQGRWCFTTYRGKNNTLLHVVSLYRCCKPTSPGPTTTYMQQQRFNDASKDNRDPRQRVLEDLSNQLLEWEANNCNIILLADMNKNVCSSYIKNWCRQNNLTEIITKKHHQSIGISPTYHRGSNPIDGIFISPNLKIDKCGYFPFGSFPSDHRALWIDISITETFGSKMSALN